MIMIRLLLVLRELSSRVPSRQDKINGSKNVWVVKAPDASCGTGLKLLYRLGDILECERGLGGRTVQKYIESPLLVPRVKGRVDPVNTGVIRAMYGPATALYGRQSAGATTGRIPRHILASPEKQVKKWPKAKENEKGMGGNSIKSPSGRKIVKSSTLKIPEDINENVKWYKFDVRVWVLVTSFEPLKAFVFDRVYGRQCGRSVNTGLGDCRVDTLGEHLMHLTNYSIQKRSVIGGANTNHAPDSSNSSAESVSHSASVKNLRRQVDDMRNIDGGDYGGGGGDDDPPRTGPFSFLTTRTSDTSGGPCVEKGSDTLGRSACREDLLLSHEEILSIVNATDKSPDNETASSSLKSISRWQRSVWPSLKRKIAVSLEATRSHPGLCHRPRSFELLGFDVIFDREFEPWILEANLSPAMAHRGTAQSRNIATMAEGLLKLAVLPHVAEEARKDDSYPYANSTTIGPTITTATGATFDLNPRPHNDISSSVFEEELAQVRKRGMDEAGTFPSDEVEEANSSHTPTSSGNCSTGKEMKREQGKWEALPAVENIPTPSQPPLYAFSSRPEYSVPDTSIIPVKSHQKHSWSVVKAPGQLVYSNKSLAVGEASISPRGGNGVDHLSGAMGLTSLEKKAVTTHTSVMPHLRTRHIPTPPALCRPKSASATTVASRTARPRSALGTVYLHSLAQMKTWV